MSSQGESRYTEDCWLVCQSVALGLGLEKDLGPHQNDTEQQPEWRSWKDKILGQEGDRRVWLGNIAY